MEVLIHMIIIISVFLFGVALGAIVENRRLSLMQRIDHLEKTTQEIFLPLAEKIDHISNEDPVGAPNTTWHDYEAYDPEETLELPKKLLTERGKNGKESEKTWTS